MQNMIKMLLAATILIASVVEIQAVDWEKASFTLDSIEAEVNSVKSQVDDIFDETDQLLPLRYEFDTWQETSEKLIAAMKMDVENKKLKKKEAEEKIKSIVTSLQQAKAFVDKFQAGYSVSEDYKTRIAKIIEESTKQINVLAKELYSYLPA